MNRKSYLITAVMAALLVLWMLSGLFVADEPPPEPTPAERPAMDVQVQTVSAETVTRFIENQGDTQADQDVTVRAETSGRVVSVQAAEGDPVEAGDGLVELAMNDREARRAEAQARVVQRSADLEAAERLRGDGFQSERAVDEARAALEAARAQLAAINQEIDDTRITAPMRGLVEARMVSVGDFVSVADPIARLLQVDPLIVVANVAQQEIRQVQRGREVEIELATGDALSGKVTRIARAADEGSRTFRVEVTAPNPEGLPVGVSATLRIPLDSVEAHFVSPAWLSLADTGEVGVKAVDEDDRVVFHPVEIVRSQREGMWVTGLPERLELIAVGQGFVREGERVRPVTVED